MPFVVVVATLLFGQVLDWARLPDIPDAEGFAGGFAGTSGGAVIVAGGANFPQGRPWEGGRKVWHDRIFILEEGAAAWRVAGRLPRPLAYGAAVSHVGRVVCIGGSDAGSHHAEVFSMRRDGESVAITKLSPLPRPLAMHCAAVVGDRVFVAGGAESPQATEAACSLLSLDLADPAATWTAIEPWPGPGRILATAGAIEGRLCVVGGAGLVPGVERGAERIWLRDAYLYDPVTGWTRLPDLPRPVVAAPSPAVAIGGDALVILGGDDGGQVDREPATHRGFRRDPLAFDVASHAWRSLADMPFALVTTATVRWKGGFVVPGGESRPGIRSTEVWHGVPRP
jgi:N-acetylneuraminic acid mutarotase